MPKRKIDIIRIRKYLLPPSIMKGPEKGKSPLDTFIEVLSKSKKGLEIEDKDERIIVWETIEDK